MSIRLQYFSRVVNYYFSSFYLIDATAHWRPDKNLGMRAQPASLMRDGVRLVTIAGLARKRAPGS